MLFALIGQSNLAAFIQDFVTTTTSTMYIENSRAKKKFEHVSQIK